MTRRTPSKGKKIKPKFWVFCEGETEEDYVRFLRETYRIPIEIKTKISGTKINDRYIRTIINEQPIHKKDKVFLMYDADIVTTLDRILGIPNTIPILSNPTIELWFLLHYKNQIAEITQSDCIKQICARSNTAYKKGRIDKALQNRLTEKRKEACKRARELNFPSNPSTNQYHFIELLEAVNN
jgi:hypothetical protein